MKLSTKNNETEKESYLSYFGEKESQYLISFIVMVILLVVNVISTISAVTKKINIVAAFNIALLIVIIVYVIVYWCRYTDAKKVVMLQYTERKTVITYNKIKGNEVNGVYCKMYIDDKDKNIIKDLKVGGKYELTYLDGTMGKYIISVKER